MGIRIAFGVPVAVSALRHKLGKGKQDIVDYIGVCVFVYRNGSGRMRAVNYRVAGGNAGFMNYSLDLVCYINQLITTVCAEGKSFSNYFHNVRQEEPLILQ